MAAELSDWASRAEEGLEKRTPSEADFAEGEFTNDECLGGGEGFAPENLSRDEFEKLLDEKRAELAACQAGRGGESCYECAELFSCGLRRAYVDAVYASMAKGRGGGFEF